MATATHLIASMNAVGSDTIKDDSERVQIKEAAQKLLRKVETPFDTMWLYIWGAPAVIAALKVGGDLHLFEKWKAHGGGPKSGRELAEMVGLTDAELLIRLLRHMAACYVLEEVGEEIYRMTRFTESLSDLKVRDAISCAFLITYPGFLSTPAFLKSTNYIVPSENTQTAWAHMLGRPETFFETMSSTENTTTFQNLMYVYSTAKPTAAAMYPVAELYKTWKRDRPFIVDVGGGRGHDIERLVNAVPETPPEGSFVLQDQQEVLMQANLQPPITKSPHNFFTPQPIKGAALYHLHTVIHDWPDDQAVDILSHLAQALERNYSRIILLESVVATRSPHPMATASDLTMMLIANGKERTERDWKELAKRAGLKAEVWWGAGMESVVEMVLA